MNKVPDKESFDNAELRITSQFGMFKINEDYKRSLVVKGKHLFCEFHSWFSLTSSRQMRKLWATENR